MSPLKRPISAVDTEDDSDTTPGRQPAPPQPDFGGSQFTFTARTPSGSNTDVFTVDGANGPAPYAEAYTDRSGVALPVPLATEAIKVFVVKHNLDQDILSEVINFFQVDFTPYL
jgi:hypothetical protein